MRRKPARDDGRSKVDRVVLVHGLPAPRPLAQCLVGIVLLGFLAWPLYRMWFVYRYGGPFHFWEAAPALFGILGGVLIGSAFQRGWHLRLEGKTGVDKRPFDCTATPAALEGFVRQAEREIGLVIEISPEARRAGVGGRVEA